MTNCEETRNREDKENYGKKIEEDNVYNVCIQCNFLNNILYNKIIKLNNQPMILHFLIY